MRTILLDTSHALVAIKCKKNNSIVCTNTKVLDISKSCYQKTEAGPARRTAAIIT